MGLENIPSRESKKGLETILHAQDTIKLKKELSDLTRDLAEKLGAKTEASEESISLGEYGYLGHNYGPLQEAIEASEEYKALAHEAQLLGREVTLRVESDENPEHVIYPSDAADSMEDPHKDAYGTHVIVTIDF